MSFWWCCCCTGISTGLPSPFSGKHQADVSSLDQKENLTTYSRHIIFKKPTSQEKLLFMQAERMHAKTWRKFASRTGKFIALLIQATFALLKLAK